MEFRKIFRRGAAIAGAGALLGAAIPAQAVNFQFDELDISIETALSATTGVRTSSRDTDLIGKANNVGNFGMNTAGGAAGANNVRGAFSVNGDDGSLNYDKWDFFFSRLGIISDITVRHGDFGVFLRPSYLWDPRLIHDDFADRDDYGPARARSVADLRRKNDRVVDEVANNPELFDAYFFGRIDLFDRNVSFKIGRQVLNWGESTFVQNGINSIIAANANRAFPGAEVKEIFIPTSMAWVGFDLTQNVSLEAFWQLEQQESVPFGTGTFFSTSDIVTPGGSDAHVGFGRCDENSAGPFTGADLVNTSAFCSSAGGSPVGRVASEEASDYNQFGGRLSFYIPELNNMEFSLYAMRYNSRLPLLAGTTVSGPTQIGNPATLSYQQVYPERIDLYGLSFNTYSNLLDVALQGEYSIKRDQPLNFAGPETIMFGLGLDLAGLGCVTSICKSGAGDFAFDTQFDAFQRFDVHQVDLGFTKIMGPGQSLNKVGANQIVLIGEAAATYVEGLPSSGDLPFGGSGDFAPNEPEAGMLTSMPTQDRRAYGDKLSWGYRLLASLRYNNVFNIVNVVPNVRFFHDVDGNTPSPLGNFVSDTKLAGFDVTVEYRDKLEFGGGYTVFWGGERSTLGSTDVTDGTRVDGSTTNNLRSDRDFASLFVRYTF